MVDIPDGTYKCEILPTTSLLLTEVRLKRLSAPLKLYSQDRSKSLVLTADVIASYCLKDVKTNKVRKTTTHMYNYWRIKVPLPSGERSLGEEFKLFNLTSVSTARVVCRLSLL